ncbi:unnamed protein product, partial [Cylindrotheca closterium]
MPGRRNQGRGGRGGRGGRSAQQTGRGSHGKKADRPKQYHPHNPDFTHEQVTIYLVEAIALKSLDYTQDMIWSVRNMARVDFEALRGTQTVYKPGKTDSEFFKSSRQAQLDRNWENLNVKFDKREVIYTTNQYTVAAIITKHFITQAMKDKLSNETDWLDLKVDHVMLLLLRAGRANLQVPATASAAQSDAASSVTGTQSTGQQHRSNMQRAVVDRSGNSTSGTTDVTGSYVVRGRSVADGRSDGRITGWNLTQVRVSPILKKKTVSTEDRGELLMKKWQAQLEAASTFKDDDSMVSNGSLNMQIYKSTSKMDSLKHCSQWTKDNKKPFKSNG